MITSSDNVQKQNILSNCLRQTLKKCFHCVKGYSKKICKVLMVKMFVLLNCLWLSFKVDLMWRIFSASFNYLCQDKISLYAANLKIIKITNWWTFFTRKIQMLEISFEISLFWIIST